MRLDRFVFRGSRPWSMTTIAVCVGCVLALPLTTWAMEPLRPGEAEQLAESGELGERLDFAYEIGNHEVDPRLVGNLQQQILQLQGIEALMAPPGGQAMPASGDVRVFALLIEFNDEVHSVAAGTIDSMLFGAGNFADYPRESLANYYDRSSYGLLNLSNGATLGWYQTAYDRSAVVETTAGRENLIKEALNHYDSLGHDFSQYDNDGDGDVDYFIVMWTGPVGDWATFWWGYQPGWSDGAYTLDGKTLTKYSWQWESDSPVVVIHETGHGLGLPDLYDYDPTTGPGTGVGGFDMMDGNAWDHNCFSKWMLEWLTPTVVSAGRQSLTLGPTATDADAVLIWPGFTAGDMFQEFFMVQNRQAVNNDDRQFSPDSLPPDGLSIWHIDSTLSGGGFAYNNSDTSHKLVRLMEADGLEEIEAYACCEGCFCHVADSSDLYSAGLRFSQLTTPASTKYDGTDSCVTVCDIEGLGLDMSASFSTECSQPPTCDTGGPYEVECQGTSTVVSLTESSSDPDAGEPMDYLWSTDCPGGMMDDETSPTPDLTVDSSPGCLTCSVTLALADCAGNEDNCSSEVSVVDTLPPNISCPSDKVVECDESTAPSDTGVATAADQCDADPAVIWEDTITPGACPNEFTISREWTATDECGMTNTCIQTIEVVDTTPPELIVELTPDVLWPPNHRMWMVEATIVVTDNCEDDPTVSLMSIISNEPDNAHGDGNTSNDIQEADFDTDDRSFLLRAERRGDGDGRVYTVTYLADDGCGNTTETSAEVRVPHDRSGNAFAWSGFTADGTGLDPQTTIWKVLIPSSVDFDAPSIDISRAYVGNHTGVQTPIGFELIDFGWDGSIDLILTYSAERTRALRSLSNRPLGLHYQAADGTDYAIRDVFELGTPVAPPVTGVPTAPEFTVGQSAGPTTLNLGSE